MREANAPTLGVNSWLEDELYQQYRLDHKSVDDGWGDLFIQLDENAAPLAAEEPQHPAENGAVQAPPPVAEPEPEPAAAPVAAEVAPAAIPVAPEPAPAAPVAAATPAAPAEPTVVTPVTVTDVVPKKSTAPAKLNTRIAGPSDQLVPIRGAAARIAENMTASLAIPVATSQRQIPVRVTSSACCRVRGNSALRISSLGPLCERSERLRGLITRTPKTAARSSALFADR